MHSYKSRNKGKTLAWSVLWFAVLFPGVHSEAQIGTPFSSGSTGVDGALNITTPGVTFFDPKALKLTAGTSIFNFTTITIAADSILKFSEAVFHGPVFFLASGDVINNGVILLDGDASPGPTASAAEQSISFAGSGGYSGGLGGIHSDANHAALPGNGPGGGAAGDVSGTPFAVGGQFSGNRFLVPLVGGSGGGGTNDNGQYGSQGGAGGGSILIASSTKITLSGDGVHANGRILASGGDGGPRGCGGAGGAVRLVANSITGTNVPSGQYVFVSQVSGSACLSIPSNGLVRIESNGTVFSSGNIVGASLFSLPFALNLPTAPVPSITVTSINGIPINANSFSFPDATINTGSPVPVVITATNVPLASTVNLYLLSDTQPNQTIPVKLTGTAQASTATVSVTFPPAGSRGFVKAVFQ
jgi:hypothetical protein